MTRQHLNPSEQNCELQQVKDDTDYLNSFYNSQKVLSFYNFNRFELLIFIENCTDVTHNVRGFQMLKFYGLQNPREATCKDID